MLDFINLTKSFRLTNSLLRGTNGTTNSWGKDENVIKIWCIRNVYLNRICRVRFILFCLMIPLWVLLVLGWLTQIAEIIVDRSGGWNSIKTDKKRFLLNFHLKWRKKEREIKLLPSRKKFKAQNIYHRNRFNRNMTKKVTCWFNLKKNEIE